MKYSGQFVDVSQVAAVQRKEAFSW